MTWQVAVGSRWRLRIGTLVVTALLPLPCAASAAAFDPAGSAHAITSYFATVQDADGNVLDPIRGAGRAPRYSQAMLAASALAVGDRTQRDFALRALDYVAAHPTPSSRACSRSAPRPTRTTR